MAQRSTIKVEESLARTFQVQTWLTIGPAVATGLVVTSAFAIWLLKPDLVHVVLLVGAGAVAMAVAAFFGQRAWDKAFKARILDPLGDIGGS